MISFHEAACSKLFLVPRSEGHLCIRTSTLLFMAVPTAIALVSNLRGRHRTTYQGSTTKKALENLQVLFPNCRGREMDFCNSFFPHTKYPSVFLSLSIPKAHVQGIVMISPPYWQDPSLLRTEQVRGVRLCRYHEPYFFRMLKHIKASKCFKLFQE